MHAITDHGTLTVTPNGNGYDVARYVVLTIAFLVHVHIKIKNIELM